MEGLLDEPRAVTTLDLKGPAEVVLPESRETSMGERAVRSYGLREKEPANSKRAEKQPGK